MVSLQLERIFLNRASISTLPSLTRSTFRDAISLVVARAQEHPSSETHKNDLLNDGDLIRKWIANTVCRTHQNLGPAKGGHNER